MDLMNYPTRMFLPTAIALWMAAQAGAGLRKRHQLKDEERDDFGVVQAATLTLLALLIGFSFSMATSRYDLRKNYEESEANAIGTEYVRAGLLGGGEASAVRAQLKKYTQLRIDFYRTRNHEELASINRETAELQNEMWAAVRTQALAQQTPIMSLVVSGMNDVLNSQGYTQAAWWNRIPGSAWGLLYATAIFCNLLVGYGARNLKFGSALLIVMPIVIAISFLLISDIDSPRGGMIHVKPQNLQATLESMP